MHDSDIRDLPSWQRTRIFGRWESWSTLVRAQPIIKHNRECPAASELGSFVITNPSLDLVRLALFSSIFHPSFFLLHHRIVILLPPRINVSPICQARIGVIWTRQIGDDKKQGSLLSRVTSASLFSPPHT